MIIYNGRCALLLGSLASILGTCLNYLELLPSYERRFRFEQEVHRFAPWGLIFGAFTALVALMSYRPRGHIFLDRICIHQTDLERKRLGILSLGGFLRHSEEMLVLWDATYPSRLWTVFELAAFLKSHETSEILFRPTVLGPSALVIAVGLLLLNFNAVVSLESDSLRESLRGTFLFGLVTWALGFSFLHWLRCHFRAFESSLRGLDSFTLEQTQAACCVLQHRDRQGQQMICDRQIIESCIASWFGSTEHFEMSVRSHVAKALRQSGKYALPFKWRLGREGPC